MQTADPIVHGMAAQADAAQPPGPCAIWSLWRALAAVCLLLAASALGAQALSRPQTATVYTIPVGRLSDALALDAEGNRAFVADDAAATVSALDLASRRVLRTVAVDQPGAVAPLALAVDPATDHVFVADRMDQPTPSIVRMLDSRSGALLATVPVGHEASALAVDAWHKQVLVANETDGTLSLLDARTGTRLRTVAVGLLPLAVAVDARIAHAFVVGPAQSSGVALASSGDGEVVGLLGILDTGSSRLLHRTPLGREPSALAVDSLSGRVFVACAGDDTMRVLDTHSGAPVRTVTLEAVPSALAVDERRGRVYVISAAAGTLSLLDAHSGALLATRHVDPFASAASALSDAVAVDAARDRVYLSTNGPLEQGSRGLTLRGNGTLSVLDARTGAVVRRITVGVAPQAIVVDERSGRVVVINSGGDVASLGGTWLEDGVRRLRAWLPWLSRITPSAPSITRVPGSVSVVDPGGL